MVEDPTTDEVLWTLMPSREGASYGIRYVRPWKGKAKAIQNVLGTALFCSLNTETGKLGSDFNASTSLGFEDLYRTEQEAWEAYDKTLDAGIRGLTQEKSVAVRLIAELRRKVAERA